MGVVWRAYDERLGRDVAVKRLHTRAGLDPAGGRGLRRTGRCARPGSPRGCTTRTPSRSSTSSSTTGQPCLVMQYFPSRAWPSCSPSAAGCPVPEVARIGGEVASALAAAHRAGIVHRDVKPANVLSPPDGTAKITDFGIAHALGDVSLTSTGLVTGTPAYLAPEVARGGDASPASDVFSLGVDAVHGARGPPAVRGDATTRWPCCTGWRPATSCRRSTPVHLTRCSCACSRSTRPASDDGRGGRWLSAPGDASNPAPAAALPADDEATAPHEPPAATAALPQGHAGGLDLLWPPRGDEPPAGDEPRRSRSDEPVREGAPPPGAARRSHRGAGSARPAGRPRRGGGTRLRAARPGDDRDGATEPTTAATSRAARHGPRRPRPAHLEPPRPRTPPTPRLSPHPRRRTGLLRTPPASGTPHGARLAGAVSTTTPSARRPRRRVGAPHPALPEHHGDRAASYYESFWRDIDRVRASDVTGRPPEP